MPNPGIRIIMKISREQEEGGPNRKVDRYRVIYMKLRMVVLTVDHRPRVRTGCLTLTTSIRLQYQGCSLWHV